MATDVCNHVKVVVRVRPFSSKEKGDDLRKVVHVVDNRMLIFDPKENQISTFGIPKVQKRKVRGVNKDLKFVFDNVFGEDSTQEEIFENTTKGVLDGFMIGFNCTVFAYGATGAGKTHTMLGSPDEPGVMYRTMKELYKRMEDVKEEKVFEVACSYLEVYNEQIRDLMTNVGPLAVREDDSRKVVVQGLSLHQPKSADDILKALDHGNRNRVQHPTEMNATSSRSHAVFQIYLKQQDKNAGLNPNVCVAKMSLIDLAGSERASATNARGARLREGSNINRSLLALGNVINVLADPKSKKGHIPYRDSKLTRLLKDSLGGNCRTVMIANVSPSSKMYDDTHNTLKYADRAKQIKSSLNSNVVSLNSHVGQYAVICEKQREEILKLKQKLKEYEERKIHNLGPGGSDLTWSRKQAEFKQMSDSLQAIFSGRAQIRREQLDLERQLKENALRQRHSEEANQQVHSFCAKEKTEKATCKRERRIASLRTQQQHVHDKLIEAKKRFENNDDWLHRVENEMKLLGQNAKPPEVLEKDLYCHRLELQVNDLKQHLKQMIQLTALQDQENKRTQKLVNILLPAHSRHRVVLTEAGLASEIDYLENQELEQLVMRERGVVWADQDAGGEQCTTEDGTSATSGDLVPILSFSHLAYHQNSPCSAELPKKMSSRLASSFPSTTGDQGAPAKRPCRRNLSASLPPHGPVAAASARQPGLQVTEEGMFPLPSTPLPQRAPSSSSSAAAAAAGVKRDKPRDTPPGDTAQDMQLETQGDAQRETKRDRPRDRPRAKQRDAAEVATRDKQGDAPRVTPRATPRATPRDTQRDTQRDTPQTTPQATQRDSQADRQGDRQAHRQRDRQGEPDLGLSQSARSPGKSKSPTGGRKPDQRDRKSSLTPSDKPRPGRTPARDKKPKTASSSSSSSSRSLPAGPLQSRQEQQISELPNKSKEAALERRGSAGGGPSERRKETPPPAPSSVEQEAQQRVSPESPEGANKENNCSPSGAEGPSPDPGRPSHPDRSEYLQSVHVSTSSTPGVPSTGEEQEKGGRREQGGGGSCVEGAVAMEVEEQQQEQEEEEEEEAQSRRRRPRGPTRPRASRS